MEEQPIAESQPKMEGFWCVKKFSVTELYLLFVIITFITSFLTAFAQKNCRWFLHKNNLPFVWIWREKKKENNKQQYKNDDDEKKNGSYARKKNLTKKHEEKVAASFFRVSAAVTEGRRRSRRSFRYNFYTYKSNLSLWRWNMRHAAKISREIHTKENSKREWKNWDRPRDYECKIWTRNSKKFNFNWKLFPWILFFPHNLS